VEALRKPRYEKKIRLLLVVVHIISIATINFKTMRRLEFASLQVRDLEASKDFYTNKLGFEPLEVGNPEAVVFRYNKGEASFAIRKPIGNIDGKELGIGTSLWFAIDGSIEELKAAFEGKNISTLGGINQTPFGKTLLVKDPDGYVLTFMQPNS
jgi:catechol 2,3-dioxygenase-like lactoylglutathione lyase family enzyme